MEKIRAIITGVGGYVPDYILNNDELSQMVDTSVTHHLKIQSNQHDKFTFAL